MDVIGRIVELGGTGESFTVATVVGVKGSTYRGLGARQVMVGDGTRIGTVSGGCLDQDIDAIAQVVAATGEPQVVSFDLTADEEAVWGWGIGCNGVTTVLVEPGATAAAKASAVADIRRRHGRSVLIHHLSEEALGSFDVVDASSAPSSPYGDEVADALRHGRSSASEAALIELVDSPARVVVCGAGHDAEPLVRQAQQLGFHVAVIDDRAHLLTEERFPGASRHVIEAADMAHEVTLDEYAYVVLISHNYLRDLEYLRVLSRTEVAYIGALGPAARLERLLGDLVADGDRVDQAFLARLHGPAGLDIGAEGPVEIAWAIMAEIVAVQRGRGGGHHASPSLP